MDCSTPDSSVLHCLLLGDMFSENVCFGVFFPGVCSDSCRLTWWWSLTISSSATPFPFAFNLSQHQSVSFPMSRLCIKWPKYWSFSFSPSNEYSRLISFGIGLISLQSKGTLKSLLCNTIQNHLFFVIQPSIWSNSHDYWKTHSFDNMDLCWQNDVSAF